MSIRIQRRDEGEVTILSISGRLAESGPAEFRDAIHDLRNGSGRRNKFLLDLQEVSYVNSSGIGELVSAFTCVTNQGGQLKLLSVNKRVKDLLQITKLYTVFEVFENEREALRSFS